MYSFRSCFRPNVASDVENVQFRPDLPLKAESALLSGMDGEMHPRKFLFRKRMS